jgi:hypothetical protein
VELNDHGGEAGEPSRPTAAELETALRHLGTTSYGHVVDHLEHAIERPRNRMGTVLAPLTASTAACADWPAAVRAEVIWQVIQEGVESRDVGPTLVSRRRRALQAAFRMPDDEIGEEWGPSLTARFKQLRRLRAVFHEPTTTQPMERAWQRGVRGLSLFLAERFAELQTPDDWRPYVQGRPERSHSVSENRKGDVFRPPSRGAQPVFLELLVMTIFMKGRLSYRRVTERLVTARADGVEYYVARNYVIGHNLQRTFQPVHALWGCRAENVVAGRAELPTTRLWFPRSLRNGEQAFFASETMVGEEFSDDRDWVNVDVDHHGIARGETLHGGRLPTRGLTIRVRFDPDELPEAAWWYAEANESERYSQPPPGDPQLLELNGADLQKTFTEHPCQPRESYGIAFRWPD